ncbi:MAG: hypothetical protein DMG88_18780 [Acidobacteria bacterium]|nr:MAG: hypothetical protein DMG88_18780 [Acidobacteriota bacterium]
MELFSLEEEAAHVAGWPFRFWSPVVGRQGMVMLVMPTKSDAFFTDVRHPGDVGAGVSPVREFPI